MGKCLFSERWLTLPQYSRWLARGSSGIHKAYCCLCSKSFDISAMGEAALKSHMIGKKHVDLDKIKDGIGTMKAFIGRPTTSSTTTDSAQVRDGASATASSRSERSRWKMLSAGLIH